MTVLTEDFVDVVGSFWTGTVGVVSLANSLASGSADPTKLVVTSSVPTGTQQEAEAYVKLTAQPAVAPELWCRVVTSGTDFVQGYGVRLTLASATTATLEILHTTAAETITTIATSGAGALTPAQDGASAVNIEQHIRLVVFERITDSEAAESLETVVRAYLNETRDDAPTVEIIHKGGVAGVERFIWRDAGTYAIRFRALTGFVDSWAGRDDYVGPTYDVLPGDRTTLGAMRAQVQEKLTLAGLSNLDTAMLNRCILEATRSIVSRLGDKALFMERFERMDFTSASNYTVTLPRDVGRVIAVYDGNGSTPIGWSALAMDAQGRQILTTRPDNMSARGVWLHYVGKVKPPTSDAHYLPVPSTHDECTLHGAIVRYAGMENRQDVVQWSATMFDSAYADLLHAMTVILRSRRLVMRVVAPRRRGAAYEMENMGRASYEWTR